MEKDFPHSFSRHLAALGAALLVLGGHFWMINRAGSPVPIHDQWQAEADMFFLPALEHRLTLAHVFQPNGPHRIVPTRLLTFALFEADDRRWDVRLQMTVNAFLAAALAGLLVHLAAHSLGPCLLVLFAAAFGTLLASPLFYGNALWGFQSQFYFLLLFSMLHFGLVLSRPAGSAAWWLGIVCSILASVSMGSGFFSAGVVAAMQLWLLLRQSALADRRSVVLNLAIHVVICVVAIASAPAVGTGVAAWSDAIHTFLHCLAWPARFFTPYGAWIWLPFAAFLPVLYRRSPAEGDPIVASLGLWVLAQIAAISWVRSTPAIVITPRYYEIFWLGLAVNALALSQIYRRAAPHMHGRFAKMALALVALAWCGAAGSRAWSFAESHRRYDLPTMAKFRDSQIVRVRAFIETGDLHELQSVPYPQVPHPDPVYLAGLLRNPRLRAILPPELNDLPPPFLSRTAADLRHIVRPWFIAGLAALATSLWLAWCPRPPMSLITH